MNSTEQPIDPQPLADVLSIMQLRHVLIEHVRAGSIPRADYDALFDVLCETHNLLPWYRPEVTRAVQLVALLAKQFPLPTAA